MMSNRASSPTRPARAPEWPVQEMPGLSLVLAMLQRDQERDQLKKSKRLWFAAGSTVTSRPPQYGGVTFRNIPGATNPSLSFVTSINETGHEYRATFTNASGNVSTNPVTLTVLAAPAVTVQPANQIVVIGQTASFTAAASGGPFPAVQWQESKSSGLYTDIPGATSPSYSFATTAADEGDLFRAVFTNVSGMAATDSARLTVASASSSSVTVSPSGVQVGGMTTTVTLQSEDSRWE